MIAIRVPGIVGKDRKLVIDVPDEVLEGPLEVELRFPPLPPNPDREELRSRLQAAGLLVTFDDLDDDLEYVSDEELEELGKLPPGAPSSEALIDEDRGPH